MKIKLPGQGARFSGPFGLSEATLARRDLHSGSTLVSQARLSVPPSPLRGEG